MKSYKKKVTRYHQNRTILSDVALLVQRNEDLHNKCKFENERLSLKVNRLLKKIIILKKKIEVQNKDGILQFYENWNRKPARRGNRC